MLHPGCAIAEEIAALVRHIRTKGIRAARCSAILCVGFAVQQISCAKDEPQQIITSITFFYMHMSSSDSICTFAQNV